MTILYLHKNDLRLSDNPSLLYAAETATSTKSTLVPLYVYDDEEAWPVQGASAWWLQKSLAQLAAAYLEQDICLRFEKGDSLTKISQLLDELEVSELVFALEYDHYSIELQSKLHNLCEEKGIVCKRFAGLLLTQPEQIKTLQGEPFKVFTPFYKSLLKNARPSGATSDSIQAIESYSDPLDKKELLAKYKNQLAKLDSWPLKPEPVDWASEFPQHFQPGEAEAYKRLEAASKNTVSDYSELRNFPATAGTSRLSPYLRFGELSPRQVWMHVSHTLDDEQSESFLRQLVWREFSYHLLFHFQEIDKKPFKEKFERFPWVKNNKQLIAWQKGLTGYPIVDAGMRQLWRTGWMHNRVRMVVASFLCKHLRIHWHEGARWFWDTLLDADLANNSCSWQWVAGSGADAAPYFRIFNPVTQGEKFDKNGGYVRKWVPELKDMPDKYLHNPWEAPRDILKNAGVQLGRNYPKPIVDHKTAREKALESYGEIKG